MMVNSAKAAIIPLYNKLYSLLVDALFYLFFKIKGQGSDQLYIKQHHRQKFTWAAAATPLCCCSLNTKELVSQRIVDRFMASCRHREAYSQRIHLITCHWHCGEGESQQQRCASRFVLKTMMALSREKERAWGATQHKAQSRLIRHLNLPECLSPGTRGEASWVSAISAAESLS